MSTVALVAASLSLVVPMAAPAAAAGTGAKMGMPFEGWWDRFAVAHPSYHGPAANSYADWAVDIYQAPGTAVRPRFTAPGLALKVASVGVTCGSAGYTVRLDVHTNGEFVGTARYGHLSNVRVSANQWISPSTVIGYLAQYSYQSGCWEVTNNNGVHTHVTGYNNRDYSCYVNVGSGSYLGDGHWIGVVGGALASSAQKACSGSPFSKPSAPGTPSCSPTNDGRLTTSWGAAAANGAGIEEYQVHYRNNTTGNTAIVSTGTSRSNTFSPSGIGQPYQAQARARNADGWGPWSAWSNTCVPRKPPGAPGTPSCIATDDARLKTSWTAAAANGNAIAEYQVVYLDQSTSASTPVSAGTSLTNTSPELTVGHPHQARVRARNVAGWGAWSAWSATCTPAVPPPPSPGSGSGSGSAPGSTSSGYWMVGGDGAVYAFGDAPWLGNAPVGASRAEDIEPTPSGSGYWVVSRDGAVFAFGDAAWLGRAESLAPGEVVTSLSATSSGAGYWLFTSIGRVLAFGDAAHLGDMAGTALNGPVLDSIPTPTGRGYYMVGSDGGIFTFGDAVFRGSMGATPLNAPVQSLVPRAGGGGYWLVASDGGIFTFDAPFHGSMGSTPLNRPVTGMVAAGSEGYLMVAEDGGVFTFGTAAFHGSLGDRPPAAAITSVAARNR